MTSRLQLSTKLALPLDVVGEAIGILATRGAGKSYTSAALVEEIYGAGVQFAVLDPTGVYWGLRASSDGKHDGLPIHILGGAHGDVPLEPTAGALIADVLVDTGQSMILDFSDFGTKGEQTRFVTAFAERLYARKARNRSTLHVIVDEANEFAPQRPMRDEARMLGAMERAVGKGRSRGLAFTLISQRSAALNKNVLDLIDTLMVMRIGSARDRAAVRGWFTSKALEDEAGLMDTLPGLPTGTAWVWSPVRDILQKVAVRRIRTFDSYATPKPGQKRAEPKTLAPIDVEQLGEQIAATRERVKAEDPRELRKTIRALEKALDNSKATGVSQVTIERVEVPILRDTDAARLERTVAALQDVARKTVASFDEVAQRIIRSTESFAVVIREARAQAVQKAPVRQHPTPPQLTVVTRAAPPPARSASSNGDGESELWKANGERNAKGKILDALAWLESVGLAPANRTQLALLADASPKSSAYANNLGRLSSLGLVGYPVQGQVQLTNAGMEQAIAPEESPTTESLQGAILAKLGGAKARLLRVLIDAYPDPLPKADLAARAGASLASSAFANNLGALRSLRLIDYPDKGWVVAQSVLFLGGARV